MARIMRHGSTLTLPPDLVAQLGDETELEVTKLGNGVYIETIAQARKRDEGRKRLDAVLARRRAQSPETEETPEEIDEIVQIVKEVRRQHAITRPL